jgi:drug/metabolite transporter (DMT)-like permease
VNAVLFLVTSLLWGCGALATTMQAGVTPAAWSVSLRMALAGFLLLAYGRARKAKLDLRARDIPFVGLQGVLFFALAFVAFYEATSRIPSGLAALVLATSSLFAAAIGRAVHGEIISRGLVWGTLFGLCGIAAIFGPGLHDVSRDTLFAGFAWALLASVATAAGTVTGARNQKAGVPTFAGLGWAALIGGAASAAWALATGEPFVFDFTFRFVASLLYLAIGASVLTFLLYFELVKRYGSGKAAYIFTTVPIIALVLSSLFEGLQIGTNIVVGSAAILIGNVFVLRK